MNYSDFLNRTTCGILICKNDRYSTIIDANDAFYALVGYTKEEYIQKFDNKFASILLDDLDTILEKVKSAINTDQAFDLEFQVRHKNGKILWLHDIATYIPELDIFYAVIMDISYKTIALEQEKRLEVSEATSKAKEEFLSNISHDIRSPLNGILGMAQLSKDAIEQPEKLDKYLNQLIVSGNHLKLLVDSVLRIFEINSQLTELNLSTMSLSALIEEILTIISPLSDAKQQTINFRNTTQNDNVISDDFLIREVVINLLSNAIKYTPNHGEITVEIIQGDLVSPMTYEYEIRVIDTGVGISNNDLDVILEPYYRLPFAKDNIAEGNGIGLNIVKSYINLLKGSLNVISTLGKGTSFIVKIPMQTSTTVLPPQEKTQELHLKYASKRTLNILVAEDNEINAEIIETILSEWNCEITIAKNGREVVDIFKESPLNYYDCIFMDINMPRLDGYEACILIRNSFRSDSSLPIYALSAHVFPKEISTANKVGMTGYLTKPFEITAISNVINSLY